MPNDVGVLTITLKAFMDTILGGYGRIHEWAVLLLRALAIIDLTLAGIWWMFNKGEALSGLIQRMLLYGMFVWLVADWPSLIDAVLNGFMQVGVRAGGSTLSVAEFSNPTKIAELGLVATEPLFLHIKNYGFWAATKNLADIILTGLCGLAIVAAFFVVAIQMFVLFLEFYVIAVCSLILVPFGVNQYTAWISEQTFGTLLGHGVKVMVLAFITSLAFPVLQTLKLPPDSQFGQVLSMACGVWAITVLCLHAPRLAAGMLAGSPALTAGLAAATGVGAAILAGQIGSAGHRGAQLAAKGMVLSAATRLGRTRP